MLDVSSDYFPVLSPKIVRSDVSRNRGGRSAIHRGKPTGPVQVTTNDPRSDSHSSNSDSTLSDLPTSSTSDLSDSAPELQEPVHARLRHMTSLTDNAESDTAGQPLMSSASFLAPPGPSHGYSSTTSLTCDSPDSNESSPEFQNPAASELQQDDQTTGSTESTNNRNPAGATGSPLLQNHQRVSDLSLMELIEVLHAIILVQSQTLQQ